MVLIDEVIYSVNDVYFIFSFIDIDLYLDVLFIFFIFKNGLRNVFFVLKYYFKLRILFFRKRGFYRDRFYF